MKKPTAKRPAHRPTIYTPEIGAKICDGIREAMTVEESAKRAGVGKTAVFSWLWRGSQGEAPFAEFANAVQKAKKDRIAALEDLWMKHGRKAFKDVDRMLQVYAPAEYAPKLRLYVQGELAGALDRLESEFAGEPEILERALHALTGQHGAGAPAGTSGSEASAGGAGGDGGGEAVHPAPADPEAG